MTSVAHPVQGKYFDDLRSGEVFHHAVRRTVTETDNLLFTSLTMNTMAMHLDEEWARTSGPGRRVCNSVYLLGLVIGLGVSDVSAGTTVANLGFGRISFPTPVFAGDTVHAQTQIVEKRPSASRPDTGIVHFEHCGFNQHGELVATIRRAALIRRAPIL